MPTLSPLILLLAAYSTTRAAAGPFVELLGRLGLSRSNYRARRLPTGLGLLPVLVGCALQLPVLVLVSRVMKGVSITIVMLSGLWFALLGFYDDRRSSSCSVCARVKGWKGHLLSTLRGEPTSGMAKAIAGLAGSSLLSILAGGTVWIVVLRALLIAGGANLLNQFDLRPGRALKVGLALSIGLLLGAAHANTSLTWATTAGLHCAAMLAVWPEDLGGVAMLGDAGANGWGAVLGATASFALPPWLWFPLVPLVLGIQLLGDNLSLNEAVERNCLLARLDSWGRGGGGS